MVIARSLRGMNDLFATDLAPFKKIEESIQKIFCAFGYLEIRTPILEDVNLFKRSIGEDSDIVEKEMFLVNDGDHTYCLRPENTAGVVRALIERGINEDSQEKLYYLGSMFRKERPQKGRLRQFHQFGVELFGYKDPSADVEVMVMIDQLLKSLAITNVTLKINSLGTHEEREQYKALLKIFLTNHEKDLCDNCIRRIKTNPLRSLDCKNKTCQSIALNAPKIIETLAKSSRKHFDDVLLGLGHQKIGYEIDPFLVRGLDYYDKTVFEFTADVGLGAQNAVCAGGRYDGLFLKLGSKIDLPAIGCAGGFERMALLMADEPGREKGLFEIALIFSDEPSRNLAFDLAIALRQEGIGTDVSLSDRSVKAQMRKADKLGTKFVAVVGEKEIKSQKITIKNLTSKSEEAVALDKEAIRDFLRKTLKKKL